MQAAKIVSLGFLALVLGFLAFEVANGAQDTGSVAVAGLFFALAGWLMGFTSPRFLLLAGLCTWPELLLVGSVALSLWPRFASVLGPNEPQDVLWMAGIWLAALGCSLGGAYLGALLRTRRTPAVS